MAHQYLTPIEPGAFTDQLALRLLEAGYTVAVDDDSGGCRLPTNVSPGASVPLCRVTAANGDTALPFTVFSPTVADRRFPAADASAWHLIAVAATTD